MNEVDCVFFNELPSEFILNFIWPIFLKFITNWPTIPIKGIRKLIVYGKNPRFSSYPPFEALITKKEDWLKAISKLIDRIQALSGDQE